LVVLDEFIGSFNKRRLRWGRGIRPPQIVDKPPHRILFRRRQ
jgi:hypothetical protein